MTLDGTLVVIVDSSTADGTVLPVVHGEIEGACSTSDALCISLAYSMHLGEFSAINVSSRSTCRTFSGSSVSDASSFSVLINVKSDTCKKNKKGLSTGAIIGIAVGVAVVLIAIAVLVFLLLAKKYRMCPSLFRAREREMDGFMIS